MFPAASSIIRWTFIVWLAMTASLPASDVVDQLRRESNSAFERGLLPVVDFLDHHSAAEEVRLQHLHDPSDPVAIRLAMQPRREALRMAVEQMERFHQPAAASWSADLLLLRHALAQADLQAALWTADRKSISRQSRETQTLAWQHYRQRVIDARFLGHGSLLQLMDSVALLQLSPPAEIAYRQQTLGTLEHWARQGAGIGRSDAVRRAGLDLANAQLQIRDVSLPREALPRFLAADRLASELFADQQRYLSHGTASLSDLSRSWRLRRQIHDQALWVDMDLPASARDSMSHDLQTLEQLARQTLDRRGRVASDVLYVEVLREGVTAR